MAKEVKPELHLHSGWCMKWPVSKYNQEEHDKCPALFSTSDCICPCGHKGKRSLESREMTRYEVTAPRTRKVAT